MSKRRFLVLLVVGAMLAVGVTAVPASTGDGGDSLPFSSADGPRDRAADPEAIRERYVTIDTSSFGLGSDRSLGHRVTFNLFEDTIIEATLRDFTVLGDGDFTWSGLVAGDGLAVISVVDGAASGRFFDAQMRSYRLRYAGDGIHVIQEIAPGPLRAEGEPRVVDLPALVTPEVLAAHTKAATYELRIMFVYSTAAMNRRGGEAPMNAAVATTVAEANTALATSGIDAEFVLADSRKIAYSETGDLFVDLDAVTNFDGVIDKVHTWRDNSFADFVVFVTWSDTLCGLAWTMTDGFLSPSFEAFAFSVVSEDCLDDGISTIHEVGHNLSANHEFDQVQADGGADPLFSYSFGYYDDVNDFGTIMAYGNFCSPQRCPNIPQFSSNSVLYQGHATGNGSANNARGLNKTVPTAADFRVGGGGGGGGGGGTTPTCNGLDVTIEAVAGVVTRGTAGDDVILGTDEADTIKGRGGHDTICGEGGNDLLLGQGGRDTIFGGAGKDIIKGGGGKDDLFGEGGRDTLIGNRGTDTGDGGPGVDTCRSIETTTSC